ncbi:MAG TPA: DUF1702 family protein [Thermoanaerobaculia bacterium]|nr:DUF1702 family protein [Thermoanaerobaculia bacterium]
MGRLRRKILGIAPDEVLFARRRFRCDEDAIRERLEEVGRSFVRGYTAALEADRADDLAARLELVPRELRGFACEGAGMALALLDLLTPWRRDRLRGFLAGPGAAHVYIVHIGAGWALARLPVDPGRLLSRLDPLLGWLAFDGYGFHQGFFHWPRAVVGQEVPGRLRGYARRVFDHGLGRSLWFVEGADPGRIAAAIEAFPARRQPDLWAGVGLACAYAGGVEAAAITALRRAAGGSAPLLAQGAAFAATARVRAGNSTPATELACGLLCGCSAAQAAAACDEALPGVPEAAAAPEPAFEVWRRRIELRFSLESAHS